MVSSTKIINVIILKTASSTVLGGTISEIGGGKFANGAITGAYGMLFNDMMHEVLKRSANNLDKSLQNDATIGGATFFKYSNSKKTWP